MNKQHTLPYGSVLIGILGCKKVIIRHIERRYSSGYAEVYNTALKMRVTLILRDLNNQHN